MDADVELIMNAESWDDKAIDQYEDDRGDSDSEPENTRSSRGGRVSGTKVLIENLPYSMQWQDLKDLVKDHVAPGLECFVDLLKDSSGRSTGDGIVNFNKPTVAEKAIRKLDGLVVNGRKLSAREDSGSSSRKRRRSRSGSPRLSTKRIHVGNIPYSTTWQELKDFFRDEVGSVDFAAIDESPDGVSKGSGVVSFHAPEKAREAINKLNNAEFHGRKIFIREETERDRQQSSGQAGGRMSFSSSTLDPRLLQFLGITGEPTNTVYVGNLESTIAWQKLKDMFRMAGSVQHVKLPTDYEGRSRGVALVSFDNCHDAVQAISMFNGSELQGRPMYVRMCTPNLERNIIQSNRRIPPSDSLSLERVGMSLPVLQQTLGIQAAPTLGSLGVGGGGGGGVGGGSVSDVAGMAIVLQQLLGGAGAASNPGLGSQMGTGRGTRQGRGNSTTAVCVENLDRSVSWQTLKDFFKPIGNVQFADVYKNAGRSTSCGAIKFLKPEDAERAVRQMNGARLEGKSISVYLDN